MNAVLRVIDSEIRSRRERLALSRRKADEGARRKGHRVLGADDHCEWLEHRLAALLRVREAVEKLGLSARALVDGLEHCDDGRHRVDGKFVNDVIYALDLADHPERHTPMTRDEEAREACIRG